MPVVVAAYGKWDGKGLAKAQRDLDRLKNQAGVAGSKTKSAFAGAGAALAGMGAAAVLAAGAATVAIGTDAVKAASDFNETVSKTTVLFGDQSSAIQDWAKTAATAYGQSQQQAMDAAATFAIFGKSAGLSGKELTKFSTGFTELASDMASFSNTTPQDAIDAIGAALRGETEPIRRYGVLLDDATMKAEAMRLGIIKTTKNALTPQQKVLAAQALIYKQTTAAQGDFARTSGGLANQQRILSAQWENLKVTMGQALLPTLLTIVKAINENLVPAFNVIKTALTNGNPQISAMATAFKGVWTSLQPILTMLAAEFMKVWNQLKPILIQLGREWSATYVVMMERLKAFIDWVTPYVMPILRAWAQAVGSVLKGVMFVIRAVLAVIRGDWKAAWANLKSAFGAFFSGFKTYAAGLLKGFGKLFTDLVAKAKQWGKNLIDEFIDGIKARVGRMTDALRGAANKIKDFLGFSSPTKEGPGSTADRWAPNLVEMFAQGIAANMPMLQAAAGGMAGALQPAPVGGTSRSITIAPGAIQIVLPAGTPQSTASAAADSVLAALAREIKRS